MSDLGTPDRAVRRHTRRAGVHLAIGIVLCASLLAPAALAGTAAAAEPEIPPVATTSPAVAVAGGYTLKGTIYTYSLDTHYHFEYGTTTAYGTNVPVPDADAGTSPVVPVAQTVTGLAPSTTYHFRIVAENSKGPGMSSDATFMTSADPSAPPPPAPSPTTGGNEAGSGGSGKAREIKLKTVKIKGHSILATSARHSLYSLSAEKNGKFICTRASGCLALWHPLMVPKGATPTGPVKLGTIKRPEGGMQVTYHGRPLYSYALDTKPGQAQGEGLKDVGTWHAVTVPKSKA
jgi:predicted lipoprotein with Yx(FWY)xxD motif